MGTERDPIPDDVAAFSLYYPSSEVMLSYVTTSVNNSDPDAFDEAFDALQDGLFEIVKE